jgi:hypothetical protein
VPFSIRSGLPIALLALVGLFALLGLPGPAGAVDAAKPSSCTGAPFATDPANDGIVNGGITGTEAPAPPNMEITAFFFNYGPDKTGKPVLTANLQVKNLDKTVPDPYLVNGGIYYYFHWASGGESRFVKAANDGTDITYGYGTVDSNGIYTTDGETTGNFFEGPDGIVQIDVPEALNGKPGEKLEKVIAVVDTIEGSDDFFGFNNHGDTAGSGDDDGDVVEPNGLLDYTVTPCPAGAAPPSGTPGPTPTPGGGTTSPPASSGPESLPLKVPSSLGSAKRAKKKKGVLAFRATASEPITKLTFRLTPQGKASPVLGKASVASLKKGTSTIKLKVSKRLKKGIYALTVQGTSGGKKLGLVQKVTVKA